MRGGAVRLEGASAHFGLVPKRDAAPKRHARGCFPTTLRVDSSFATSTKWRNGADRRARLGGVVPIDVPQPLPRPATLPYRARRRVTALAPKAPDLEDRHDGSNTLAILFVRSPQLRAQRTLLEVDANPHVDRHPDGEQQMI